MAAYNSNDFPMPPAGKTGWPWIYCEKESTIDSGMQPKITVITPSYNQGQYLEETIRSVVLQRYPNLEYIIVDGGSIDSSPEVIDRYNNWISWWVSEPDTGQSQAINKGLLKSSGEIIAWLNSDDVYLPGTLAYISKVAQEYPDVDMYYASAWFVDERGNIKGKYIGKPLHNGQRRYKFWKGWPVPQPTLFFRRALLEKVGLLDESLHYALDYDWVIRAVEIVKYRCLKKYLANYRLHPNSKTADWKRSKFNFFKECEKVTQKYLPPSSPSNKFFWLSWKIYSLQTKLFSSLCDS